MHRRLMALYVRAGQRARALRQYEHCVTVLERELGVSPLPETQALQRSILLGESSPGAKPAPRTTKSTLHWNILPSLETPLVGRGDVLEALAGGLARARLGQGGAWLLSGEPGIGKSRLLQEFVAGLEGRGTPLGVCGHEAERGLPYGPLVEALWPHMQALVQIPSLESSQRAELARLLPELRPAEPPSLVEANRRPADRRGLSTSLVESTPPAPGQEQVRLFQALSSAILGLAARNPPLVLCLDDLHWADTATLTWLSYFARQIKRAPVMILGAYRPEEAFSLASLRTELRRQGVGHELILGALTPQDVLSLVTHLGGRGRVAERLSEHLHQQTGGNPFFVLETMRAMFEAGSLRQDQGGAIAAVPGDAMDHLLRSAEHLPLTDSVQQAIRERLGRLDSGPRQVLEAGTILGYRFTLDLLQATSGRRDEEVVDGVEVLVARQLLSEQEQTYLFNHEIIRELTYSDLSSGRRQLLHRRAGEALQRLRPNDVATLAWHYEQGEGGTDRAISYLLQAGDRARSIYAYEEASQYYQRAVALLKERGETERAARVYMTLGLTAHLAMDFPRAHQAYTEGFTLWHRGTEYTRASKQQPAPHALRGDWSDPVTLDPTVAGDAASAGIIDQLFTGLGGADARHGGGTGPGAALGGAGERLRLHLFLARRCPVE